MRYGKQITACSTFSCAYGQAPAKPWLTVVMDDYSRAVAGYFLTFDAPSALNTSLALRQAIWRKDEAPVACLRHSSDPLYGLRQ